MPAFVPAIFPKNNITSICGLHTPVIISKIHNLNLNSSKKVYVDLSYNDLSKFVQHLQLLIIRLDGRKRPKRPIRFIHFVWKPDMTGRIKQSRARQC
jgi:hypothetical protein